MAEILTTLSNTPVEAWQGLIGALAGGLLTFIAVSQTNKSNLMVLKLQLEHAEKLQLQQLSRERLEELYGLIGKWSDFVFSAVVHAGMFIQREITYEEYMSRYSLKEVEGMTLVDYTRIHMIIGVYGKSFRESHQTAKNAIDKLLSVIGTYETALRQGASNEGMYGSLMEAHGNFELNLKALQTEISEAILASH